MKNGISLISIQELEKRLRPGAYSTGGFLGLTESLESVLRQDEFTLQQLGISYEQISKKLKQVLLDILVQRHKLFEENYEEYDERENSPIDWKWDIFSRGEPIFSVDNLPDTKTGFIIDNKYQVFFHHWRGFQHCPWDCTLGLDWNAFDFLLLNRKNGDYIIAPGLIVHLIREHHFFEGMESPYRVDPIKLARVLELVTHN